MPDYVPWEERERRERARTEEAEAAVVAERAAALGEVDRQLDRLDGRLTNVHLEILRPTKRLERLPGSKRWCIHLGKQTFVLARVLPAYRIRGALTRQDWTTGKAVDIDAFVTPDRSVCSSPLADMFGGGSDIVQFRADMPGSFQSVDDLKAIELRRVAEALAALG